MFSISVFEKFVLLCADLLDRIELVAPLFLLRLYRFLLIFAETLARSKIMVATLFLSPSFLYLFLFLCLSGRIFVAGFLSRTRWVGTGYELCTHGTPGKSSIITFVHFGVE